MLDIRGLAAEVEGKGILKGIDLIVPEGELHAIMGPNGSGKSTLAYVLSGREGYEVKSGSVTFRGRDLLAMEPEQRAAAGLFLAFQYPVELPGVGNAKKRNEVLQMAILRPKLAILDETDSGLDIDALRIVAAGVNALRSPDFSALIITHYQRLLDYIVPDHVHILADGRIVRSGGPELAKQLEAEGYAQIIAEAA
jgi:Fe-S cluster assembly ATP-binding protein